MTVLDQERLSEEARRLLESETFCLLLDRLRIQYLSQAEQIDPYDPLVPKLLVKVRLLSEIADDLHREATSWKISVHNARAQANAELRVSKN